MQSFLIIKCVFMVVLSLVSVSCINQQKIREITKRFEESIAQINDKVNCQVSTVKENNGCLLKAYTNKCNKRPSLEILQKSLFPLNDLNKLTAGFVDAKKLSVLIYSANMCNRTNTFYEVSVRSFGSYPIVERHVGTSQTEFNIKLSASNILSSLDDIVINSGHSICEVNNNKIDIYFRSALYHNEIQYNFKVDKFSPEEIVKVFQLHSIADVFDNLSHQQLKPLNELIFLDARVSGISRPYYGFEFYITGRPSGNDLLSSTKTIAFVVQKFFNEVADVKCILYSILNKQTFTNSDNVFSANKFFPDIPVFKLLNNELLLTISNVDFEKFLNDRVCVDLKTFIDFELSKKTLIEMGFNIFYLLDRLESNSDKLVGENEEEGSTSKETVSMRGPMKSYDSSNQSSTQQTSKQETYTGILKTHIPRIHNTQHRTFTSANNSHKKSYIKVEDFEESGDQPSHGDYQLQSLKAKHFVYKMKETQTDEFEVEPQQLVVTNYEHLVKYAIGEKKLKDYKSLPLYDSLEIMLNKMTIKKVSNILQLEFDVTSTVPLSVIDNFIEFKILSFNITYVFEPGRQQKTWLLGRGSEVYENNGDAPPEVLFNTENEEYYLFDTLDVYCQKDLVQEYAISPLQTQYEKVFKELSKFSFKKPKVKVKLLKNIHSAKIEAEGVLLDSDKVRMESILWQHDQTKEITTSLLLRNMGLDEFLKEIYQKKMLKSCWLDMKKIVLMFSSARNSSIGNNVFENEKIIDRDYRFQDALVLFGSMDINLKTGCLDDPVCNFIKNHLTHDLRIKIKGEIETTSYNFKGAIIEGSTSFGHVWGMNDIVLNLHGTSEKDSGTSIEGFITHKSTKNTGRFFVGEDDLKGNIVFKLILMKNWDDFLGFGNIRLTNINSNMDVSDDEPLKIIELSSTLEIGSSNKPLKIPKARVIVDMKSSESKENVVYVKFKNITTENFQNAFTGLQTNQLLGKMKFLDDMKICFTKNQKGYEVEEFGMYIFNPTCNAVAKMSTFAGNVTAQFDFSTMQLHFQAQKLSYMDGRLVIRRRKSSDSGPYFTTQLENRNGEAAWQLQGYVETIGYEGNINLHLNSSKLSLHFSTLLFNEIKGSGSLIADLDSDMSDSLYVFELGKKTVEREVNRHLKKHISMETNLIQRHILSQCEILIKNLSDLATDIKQKKSGMVELSESKRSDVFRKKSEIEVANEYIRRDCISSCGKKCVTALDWDHECSNVRGQNFGCLKWKDCQSEAADTNCIAICQAKKFSHSQNAYMQRDKIRYLVEDISQLRGKIQENDLKISSVENLLQEARNQLEKANKRFDFILNIDLNTRSLVSFHEPVSSQNKLEDMKPPCLKFKNITFTYMEGSQEKYATNGTFCAGGSFYKDIAHAMLKAIYSKFENLSDIKSEVMVQVIALESKFKEMLTKHRQETEEDSKNHLYGDALSTSRTLHNAYTERSFTSQENFSLFNDASMGRLPKKKTVKRNADDSTISDDDVTMFEATEMEIADFVTKDPRIFKVFESEAPWVYMNKKRGVTIPPLGMLHMNAHSKNSSCKRRRDTIEHFEDLLGSLQDAKKFYDDGKKTLEKITDDLISQKKEIIKEIETGKKAIPSRTLQHDMTFWLERNKEGISEYIASAQRQLEHQNKVGLKYWSSQLSSAVRSNIPGRISQYFHKLRDHAVSTFKKPVNKRSKVEGKDELDTMTKEFISIAEKEPLLSELKESLNRISKKIDDFKRTAIVKCKS